jgi:N-acetylglutamate synthase-like GNAT family acetyltransferase
MNIRPPTPTDIPGIMALVNEHVRRGDLLPRTAESVRLTLDDWLIGEDDEGDIVACVSLLYYTETLAEVRSLAVSDKTKGQGWGSTIVKAVIEQARLKGIPTLFALTRAVGFFENLGFVISDQSLFPEKVWRDCQLCPVRHACDETAVVLELGPADIRRTLLQPTAEAIQLPVLSSQKPI